MNPALDSRARFEATFGAPPHSYDLRRDAEIPEDYHYWEAQAAWEAWQAAIASMAAGWISVEERLPEWAARDDTPCFINNKEVPPTLFSETVLVALKGGGVRTDKLTTIEGKSAGWWHTYGERVIAWQKSPAPPTPQDPIAALAAKETT